MANNEPKPERRVDVFISIRLANVTQDEARTFEDAIRDCADDFEGVSVQSNTDTARQLPGA